jgi:acyl-CoA thioester hydrolase
MGGRWRDGWFVVPHQVIFRDLDGIGHVNNAVFFSYFEWARTLLWFDLMGGKAPFDLGFIVAHAECDFRHQLGMEPIQLWVRIGEMRTTSFDFLQEIRKADGEEIAATGKVVAVRYDWTEQRKIGITDEFRRKVLSRQSSEG